MAASDGPRLAARRSYWREEDARVVVDAWRGSGESLAGFCRRHKVKPRRLARWAARVDASPEVHFHAVRVVDQPHLAIDRSLALELPAGVTLRLPAGFDLDDLRRVLVALSERQGC